MTSSISFAHRPPLSRIQEIVTVDLAAEGYADFVIRESGARSGEFVLVSPDVGTCDDCWRDFGDPGDRRFGYPFTNCTNCGPRYTIIKDIPYDRPSTTMARFVRRVQIRVRRSDESPLPCTAECLPGVRSQFGPGTNRILSSQMTRGRSDSGTCRSRSCAMRDRRCMKARSSPSKVLAVFYLPAMLRMKNLSDSCANASAAAISHSR